jgi:heme oxygenase (biliverdin-producing, ferredoxin)
MDEQAADSAPDRLASVPDTAISLTSLMRERTRALHARAERAGIINDILRGRASRFGYALFLRNLLPAYAALERGLERHRQTAALRAIAVRELYRAPAILSDLGQMFGAGWEGRLPLLAAGERYARQIDHAASGDGAPLIAHAYTRYLGDLNGGQVMKRLLTKSLRLQPGELSFFEFTEIADSEAFKARYRYAFDECTALVPDGEAIAAEAATAFQLNIAVAEEVQGAVLSAAV